MTPQASELTTLCGTRFWRATPWDYNSTFGLRFLPDGHGSAGYGYGQSILADVNFEFVVPSPGVLGVRFLHTPPIGRFRGFTPRHDLAPLEIPFRLLEGEYEGSEANVGSFTYRWRLTLGSPVLPLEVKLPFEPPLMYYGYKDAPPSA